MWLQFFIICCSSLEFIHSLDLTELTIIGNNCPLSQNEYRNSGVYTEYTKVELNGITELKYATFYQSTSLKTIKLCSTLSIIDSSCFAYCKNLLSIEIPNGVSVINEEMFLACTNLINISLPATINEIFTSNTFFQCSELKHIYISQSNTIFSTLLNNSILVKNKVNAIAITSLYSTVNLPSQIESIGSQALGGAYKVKNINFGESSNLKYIYDSAFIQSGLLSVTFPEGLISLGSSIFTETYVNTIHLPKSLESVHPYVFYGMYSLSTVTVAPGCTGVYVQEGSGVILSKEQDLILFIPKSTDNFLIAKTITQIDATTIRKNQNLKTINTEPQHPVFFAYKNALYGNNNQSFLANAGGNKEVVVFKDCVQIDGFAFEGSLVVSVRFEGTKCKFIHNSAFINCGTLTTVVLPESMTEIYNWVFQNTRLSSINFPKSLTFIGSNAFLGCPLVDIDLSQCTSLTSFSFSSFGESQTLRSIQLPSSLTTISSQLFLNCIKLTSIQIPSSVTKIEASAFVGSGLSSIEFIGTPTLDRLEDMCFKSTQLTTITIPDSVTYIGKQVFMKCLSLKSIIIKETSKLTTIKEGIIEGSNQIQSFFIGPLVSEIAPTALSQSYGLTTVTVSSNNQVFIHNEEFSAIYAPGTNEFVFCAGGIEKIEIAGSIKKIRQNAFYMCRNLLEVKFNAQSKLDSIGKATFYGCSNITEILLPSSLEEILDSAFSDCTKLQSVTFRPNAVIHSIGQSSFIGCTSLINIEFPSQLSSIGADAFRRCNSLKTIHLPTGITTISSNAFSDCAALSHAYICIKAAQDGFAEDAFERVNREFVIYVHNEFNEPMLCNHRVISILDGDCNMPTVVFTADNDIRVSGVASLAALALYDNEN